MSFLDIQCSGKASSLFTRRKSDKKLARRIFSPIQQIDFHEHEIANHYRDFKRKRSHRGEHRRRQSSSPAKYLGSPKKRLSLTSSREILQMPSFVFPRFGKNFPWRGRQTLCNQNTSARIESDLLQKIGSAVTVSDFNNLFARINNLPFRDSSCCISNVTNSYNNPLTCHIEKGEAVSDRKPVTSTAHITNHHHRHHNRNNRKGRTRYNIATKVGGNETFDDEPTEHLEWYIQLASRCYTDGFQWHMNYLNDCTRRSALLKRRRLTGTVSQPNRITQRIDRRAVERQSTGGDIDPKISNDDRFREEDVSDCKIRININQSLNSNSNNTKATNNNVVNTRKRSNHSYVAHLNKKINIMNNIGYSIDAINNVQNDMNKTDRLNEVLDNFGSLNISCGISGHVLPQIVLTDFSSIDSMPRANTLLLTPSAEQLLLNNSISGAHHHHNQHRSQSHAECLSIPAEYYRNETRPC